MIDWDRIAELQEEVGEEDFADVLEMFFEEVEETLAGLDAADAVGLTNGLHFLKGASLNIGMADMSAQCKAYEIALKEDPGAKVDLAAIRVVLTASQAELREILS